MKTLCKNNLLELVEITSKPTHYKNMKKIDVSKFGKGAVIIPLTRKDYRLELATAVPLPIKFSLKDKVGKVKNQNGSGSCVGQAFAYYAEVINNIETKEKVELSARDIYSLIYQPESGAWLKDGASKICNSGVVLEKDAVSYDNGNPPSEQFMRNRNDITDEEIENGKTYIALKYLTFDWGNIESYKQAIVQGNGCVTAVESNNICFANAEVLVPDNKSQVDWAHAIYLIGYDDNKRVFEFVNSWGEQWGDNGFGYLPYDYITKGYASNPLTLIDVKNETYIKLTSQIKNIMELIIKALKDKITKLTK